MIFFIKVSTSQGETFEKKESFKSYKEAVIQATRLAYLHGKSMGKFSIKQIKQV